MHNLRRFYYQNKNKIWKVMLIIALTLGTIYFLDNTALQRGIDKNLNIDEEIYKNDQTQIYISNQSAISGSTVTEKEVNTINKTISKFLEYCKNGKKEEAYNMLSKDCKSKEFNTIEQFQNKYIKDRFSKDDIFEIQSWMGDTYKVSISKDALATGEINSNKKIDYITIIEENEAQKLNIKGYINQYKINKEVIQNEIQVTVIDKEIYMDYEIYNFKIKNLSDNIVKMDSLKEIGTMYLQDMDKLKYNAYAHEIFGMDMELKPEREVNISIKYAKQYSEKVHINKIVFNDVILDYVKYSKQEEIENFKEKCKIVIDL